MSTISANTFLAADGTTTTEPSIPALDQRMAKAWVNFNGAGTVAIRNSHNISSITDNSTGNYTANLATSMVDGGYCAVAGASLDASGSSAASDNDSTVRDMTASGFNILCYRQGSATYYDPELVSAVAFSQ